jgi:hypothetical protein
MPFLMRAQVKIYARISIDTSRRVRELSHSLQYELLKSARKRMEKHIPKIVGSWLAGTYDRDRGVSRAAASGVASFLDTDEKITLFWKRCQVQILDYAQEAINETPQTLSDERMMTPEDVQAKYFRVVGSSISLVINLLLKLTTDDTVKYQHKYEGFLSNNKRLWALASCEDSFVRRTVDQLLEVSIDKQPAIVETDIELISHAFIAEALRVSQSSSAFQLVNALRKVTSKYKNIWTTSYKGKKSPSSRLRHFVEKGSQGGPPIYWPSLSNLFSLLPSGVFPTDFDTVLEFLKAFRNGIGNREEPRSSASHAWNSYFETVSLLVRGVPDVTAQGKLFQDSVYPVFEQYLQPTVDNSKWSSGNSTAVLAKAFHICSLADGVQSSNSFSDEWHRLADNFIQHLNTSLPEQSKDFQKSQSGVVAESHRWFALLSTVLNGNASGPSRDVLIIPSRKIVDNAIKVAVNRNGKPYSAVATIEAVIRLAPKFVEADPICLAAITSFLENHLPKLILSPSSAYLVSLLFLLRSIMNQESIFESVWQSTIDGLLALPNSKDRIKAITSLVSNDTVANNAREDLALQDFLLETSIGALHAPEEAEATLLFSTAITFNSLAASTEQAVLERIVASVNPNDAAIDGALTALELICKKKPALLREDSTTYITLITKLLALTELSESALSSRAEKLKGIIEKSEKTGGEASLILHVIRENLETANPQSLTYVPPQRQASHIKSMLIL